MNILEWLVGGSYGRGVGKNRELRSSNWGPGGCRKGIRWPGGMGSIIGGEGVREVSYMREFIEVVEEEEVVLRDIWDSIVRLEVLVGMRTS